MKILENGNSITGANQNFWENPQYHEAVGDGGKGGRVCTINKASISERLRLVNQ